MCLIAKYNNYFYVTISMYGISFDKNFKKNVYIHSDFHEINSNVRAQLSIML